MDFIVHDENDDANMDFISPHVSLFENIGIQWQITIV